MMRGTVFVLSFAAMCASAQASSFVTPGAPATTPSIIVLGMPAPADPQPVTAPDLSLDPMQRALTDMKPGDWQAIPVDAAVAPPIATPSIVALGEPAIEVSNEKVAAIPKSSGPVFSPMVIRGGIVGGPSADPVPAPTRPEPSRAAAKPERGEDQAKGGSVSATSQASQSDDAEPYSANTTPMRKPL